MDEVEIEVEIRATTDKAWLVFDGKTVAWIALAQISDYTEDDEKIISIFIPEWLATAKGLT